MRKLTSILLFIGIALCAFADEVVFTAKAPNQVIAGQQFKLSYSVNQQSMDIQVPDFPNFSLLAGQYKSQQMSSTFINGQYTNNYEETYTYTLVAQKAGTYTISPASVKVNGQRVQSNGVKIEVLPAGQQPDNQSSTGSSTSGGEVFVRTIVTKKNVQEQEALSVTYRLYYRGIGGIQYGSTPRFPEFQGFLKQEPDMNSQQQAQLEEYNGNPYQVVDLYRCILFPQRAGDMEIEPVPLDFLVQVRVRQRIHSYFDDYFETYTNVPRSVTAPGVTIHVDPLPGGKPAGFSGAVGTFTFTPTISATEVSENEAITLKLTLSGEGNMKLIKTPAIEWPVGFEAYDPKVTNNYSLTNSGFKGSKTFEYPVIPRYTGEYMIPAVTFSYFDIKSKSYKTLSTPAYTIHVKRGANSSSAVGDPTAAVVSYTQKEDIKQLGTDIRYIDTKNDGRKAKRSYFITYNSMEFWLCYLLPLGIALLLLVILRKRIKENANLTFVRYKQANKVAKKRLKAAHKALKANDKDLFYAAIEQAAWTYLSDRLSIPTADLNKENIAAILTQKGVNEANITDVMNVLSTAEFARYAPSSNHAMDELYKATTDLINKLENQKI